MMTLSMLMLMASTSAVAATAEGDTAALTATITALDARVFDAYNRCDLKSFGNNFPPRVEFYHDNGGATFDRKTVIANTRKYICGRVRRELIESSLKVFPVKDYGAIAEGEHRFCEIATNRCEGVAKFVILWRKRDSNWQITRVLSYGHRALDSQSKPPAP